MNIMYCFVLDLHDLNDNGILIKLARNKLFKAENFYLLNTWDSMWGDNTLTIYIDEANQENAQKQLFDFIHLLSYLYNFDLSISTSLYLHSVKKLPEYEIIQSDTTKNKNIFKISHCLKTISALPLEQTKLITKSFHYYSRSLKLMELELFEDSFLTAFKPVELISNYIYKTNYQDDFNKHISNVVPNILTELFNEEYRDENKDKEINDAVMNALANIITQRRKISKSLSYLDLTDLNKDIGNLVRLRNRVGAHANSRSLSVDMDASVECLSICRKIISTFLFGNKNNLTKLNCERKIYFYKNR